MGNPACLRYEAMLALDPVLDFLVCRSWSAHICQPSFQQTFRRSATTLRTRQMARWESARHPAWEIGQILSIQTLASLAAISSDRKSLSFERCAPVSSKRSTNGVQHPRMLPSNACVPNLGRFAIWITWFAIRDREMVLLRGILFVCTGNTCRSVMAEFLRRARLGSILGPQAQIASAGIRPQQQADTQNAVNAL